MRYSIILILALLSTNLYAASTTNLREEKSLQTETRALFTDGKNTARIIQNAPMKKYFSSVLLRREQDIKTLFSFNTPVKDRYDTTAFDVKKSYYTSILRPGYQSLLSLMKQGNYTSVIDTQTRTQIEAETLGYQQAFLSGITSNLSKYISNEVLLKGNMNFSYRGSGGYIRVSLTEYDTTRSLARDQQAINMRLTVNMDILNSNLKRNTFHFIKTFGLE